MSVVKDVWYGQRSLAETYWFWGVLIHNIVIVYSFGWLAYMLSMQAGNAFPYFLYLALTLPIDIWSIVGLWRSAINHPSGWATFVKVLVIINIPLIIYYWVSLFWS